METHSWLSGVHPMFCSRRATGLCHRAGGFLGCRTPHVVRGVRECLQLLHSRLCTSEIMLQSRIVCTAAAGLISFPILFAHRLWGCQKVWPGVQVRKKLPREETAT